MSTQWLKNITINAIVLLILTCLLLVLFNWYIAQYDQKAMEPLYGNDGSENLRHVLKPNSYARMGSITYKINSLGFRDREYPVLKPKKTYRILCVGDSLTFGEGVRAQDTYPKVLEQKLQKTHSVNLEVFNTGVCGYNTYDEYWYIKNRLINLDPDLIILGFFIGNDPEDPSVEFNKLIAQRNESGPKNQTALANYVHGVIQDRQMQKDNYWEKYLSLMWDPKGPQWNRCVKALEDIKRLLDENRIGLLVFIIPNGEPNPQSRSRYHDQLTAILRTLDIWHIDGLPFFLTTGTPYTPVSRMNNHPNVQMHKIYADLLYDALEQKGYLRDAPVH